MKIFLRPAAFFAILILLLSCCLLKRPPSRPSIPAPPLVEEVRLLNERIRSLRGTARIELSYQGKRLRARQAIALAKPGFMRIETLNFLNQPLLILVTDGVTLQAMSLSENRFYRGDVSKGLAHFTGLRMSSEELVSLILGEIPLRGDSSIGYDSRRRLYVLTFPPSNRRKTETFWVDPKTLRVVEISKTDLKSGEIRILFSRFKKAGSATFPREIEIEVPETDNRIGLNFRKVEVNPLLGPDLFRLPIPPGVEVVEIDDAGGQFPRAFPAQESSSP